LHAAGIAFSDYKDQVLLEKNEVLTQQGPPYSVFTPYKRAWLQKLDAFQCTPYPVQRYAQHLAALPSPSTPLPTLEALGFTPTNLPTLALPRGMSGAQQLLQDFLPRLHAYRGPRFSGAQRSLVFVGASALWHHFHPPAGRTGGPAGGNRLPGGANLVG